MGLCKNYYFGALVLSAVVTVFMAADTHVHAAVVVKTAYPVVDRAAWGSQNTSISGRLVTPVSYVIIHHTYIPSACYTNEDCSLSMRSMQNYHISQGWDDIGYHFCVGTEGSVYEGRGWKALGTRHMSGDANNVSIGICLIGDWRVELPPPETLAATIALIADGVDLGIISQDYKLIGHNQTMATECPGNALGEEIATWPHYQAGKFNPNV